MATKKFLLVFALCLVSSVFGLRTPQLSEEQQCRFERIRSAQPSRRIESEGGSTEMWDEREAQFQCAGVHAMRNTIRPNSLSLPNYHPTPRLIFIERGQGLLGLHIPGCAETYHSKPQRGRGQGSEYGGRGQGSEYGGRGQESEYGGRGQQSEPGWQGQESEYGGRQEGREVMYQGGEQGDLHQKIHRIRRGDIIAIPAGAAHWCYNDGNEELVAIAINDLNHQANQLDQQFRAFYLAGGTPQRGQQQGQRGQQQEQKGEQERGTSYNFQNIFSAFDRELLAEAFNVNPEIIERMQRQEEGRGLVVNVRERMTFIKPDERSRQQGQQGQWGQGEEEAEQQRGQQDNGLEETFCSMRIRHNIENMRETDIYAREAGKINVVDRHKLPVLNFMDMSAERGKLYANSLLSPHWAMQGHTIVYITQGEGQVQMVSNNGQSAMNDRVNQGDMFVVPQFYTSTLRAGNQGVEWIAFKTTGSPMRSPLAGYTSIMRAMPVQVLTNSYQISPNQAQRLKLNRGGQSFLLSGSHAREAASRGGRERQD